MAFPLSKYQVPAKLFKRLGTDPGEMPPSPNKMGMMSPRSMLTKSKTKSNVLSSIPRLLRDCVDYLRDEDRDKTPGLFRIPGNSDEVDRLLIMYDAPENADMEILHKEKPTAHDVATLMKRYLMKLSTPLIDAEMKQTLLGIVAKGLGEGKDKQLIAYEVVVKALDIEVVERCALAFVLRFLYMVSASDDSDEGSNSNRMTVESLARLFAPIIMRDDDQSAMDPLKQIEYAIIVTEILIWNAMELVTRK